MLSDDDDHVFYRDLTRLELSKSPLKYVNSMSFASSGSKRELLHNNFYDAKVLQRLFERKEYHNLATVTIKPFPDFVFLYRDRVFESLQMCGFKQIAGELYLYSNPLQSIIPPNIKLFYLVAIPLKNIMPLKPSTKTIPLGSFPELSVSEIGINVEEEIVFSGQTVVLKITGDEVKKVVNANHYWLKGNLRKNGDDLVVDLVLMLGGSKTINLNDIICAEENLFERFGMEFTPITYPEGVHEEFDDDGEPLPLWIEKYDTRKKFDVVANRLMFIVDTYERTPYEEGRNDVDPVYFLTQRYKRSKQFFFDLAKSGAGFQFNITPSGEWVDEFPLPVELGRKGDGGIYTNHESDRLDMKIKTDGNFNNLDRTIMVGSASYTVIPAIGRPTNDYQRRIYLSYCGVTESPGEQAGLLIFYAPFAIGEQHGICVVHLKDGYRASRTDYLQAKADYLNAEEEQKGLFKIQMDEKRSVLLTKMHVAFNNFASLKFILLFEYSGTYLVLI
jgi:hypothetical protein